MLTPLILSLALMAASQPEVYSGRVLPAFGFETPNATPRLPSRLSPRLLEATVAGRDRRQVREYRDHQQTYSIVWHAGRGYTAFEISGDRYRLLHVADSKGQGPTVYPIYRDARAAIEKHWRDKLLP